MGEFQFLFTFLSFSEKMGEEVEEPSPEENTGGSERSSEEKKVKDEDDKGYFKPLLILAAAVTLGTIILSMKWMRESRTKHEERRKRIQRPAKPEPPEEDKEGEEENVEESGDEKEEDDAENDEEEDEKMVVHAQSSKSSPSASSSSPKTKSYIVLFKKTHPKVYLAPSKSYQLDSKAYQTKSAQMKSFHIQSMVQKVKTKVTRTFQNFWTGFQAPLTLQQKQQLLNDDSVDLVMEDFQISLPEVKVGASTKNFKQKSIVPWGIKRICGCCTSYNTCKGSSSQKENLPLWNQTAFVFDTGIDMDHEDLHVLDAKSFVSDELNPNDLNGHGTHVAGTIGAYNHMAGVASGVGRLHYTFPEKKTQSVLIS